MMSVIRTRRSSRYFYGSPIAAMCRWDGGNLAAVWGIDDVILFLAVLCFTLLFFASTYYY